MVYDDTTNDDILFDRLVDGELSTDERRRLLESLDTRPDGWRKCALAFLEAQSWGENLTALMRRPDVAAKTVVDRADDRRQSVGHRAAWLAIAAGLLVAITVGVLRRNNGPNDGPTIAGGANPNGQVAADAPQGNADDALTLWANDKSGERRSLSVPLVDASTLDRELGLQFQTGLPDDVRDQLRDRGYDVQSTRRYAPLYFDDGRPMIVPVEDTKILPVVY